MADVPDYDGRGLLTYEGHCRQRRARMADNEQQPPRSKRDRIERLRRRLEHAIANGADKKLSDIIKGILDLLDDEL